MTDDHHPSGDVVKGIPQVSAQASDPPAASAATAIATPGAGARLVAAEPSDQANASRGHAARVLRLEAEALGTLADTLDDAFDRAIRTLEAVEGRVILTGIGKSGHIARKIAATLASTGTPAHYVHAAEASHGDLGMVTAADAVVALSNSGETAELSDIVAYSRRFAIPLIAITGRAGSTLAEQADHVLLLPTTPEACPLGLAPTTSTTAMLGLGDAIAVALFERRGFSATDFRLLHPGGQLGRTLRRVGDLMHAGAELPRARPETPMAEVILEMTTKRLGCVAVIGHDGRLAGVVTDGDLRRHMGDGLLERPAVEVLSPYPKTIRPNALVAEAIGQMNTLSITNLVVTDNDKPVGIIHIHDCLRTGMA